MAVNSFACFIVFLLGNITGNTWACEDMEFLLECSTRYLTSEHSVFSFVIAFTVVDPF